MNPSTAATTGPAWAQPRRDADPFLRTVGANTAGAFKDVLAGFEAPHAPAAPTEDTSTDNPAAEATEAAAGTAQTDDAADSQPADDAKVPAAPVAEDTQDAPPAEAEPLPAGQAVATDADIQAAADRQLAHAAGVDLSRLAREQLAEQPAPDTSRTPDTGHRLPTQPDQVRPEPRPEPEPKPKPDIKSELISAHQPPPPKPPRSNGGRADWTDSSVPPPATDPGRTPPTVAAGAGGGGVPGGVVTEHQSHTASDAKRASKPGAVAAASQVLAGATRATGAKQDPSAIAINRTALLERLSASAETGRGAVAAPDQASQQALGREADRAAPNAPTQDASTRQMREAVLNTVQRGLASVLTQGGGRMTVVLRPERLGEVRVRMDTRDGVVNARLSATTDAARRTLESGLDTLRTALEARGVRVESLQIDPAPAEADARSTSHQPGSDTGANTDGQRQRADHAFSRSGRGDHSESVPGTPESDPARSVRGIWTELGLDAIA